MQTVHSSQLYPLQNGQAKLRYVGLKYPESQWVGLIEDIHSCQTNITEIGTITLEAEGEESLLVLERKLLAMAKIHGAHMVLIDQLNPIEVKTEDMSTGNRRVIIVGRCQRFEL